MRKPSVANQTPLRGKWLYDVNLIYTTQIFDITDPDTYPREIFITDRHLLEQAIAEFHDTHDYLGRPLTKIIESELIPDDSILIPPLFKIVKFVRKCAARSLNHWVIQNGYKQMNPFLEDQPIPKEEIEKRRFFLRLAREVIFRKESPNALGKWYNINPTNILIWVHMFLNHGPSCFFQKSISFPRELEWVIPYNYYAYKTTIPHICSWYGIMNEKSLNRMLKRYPGHPM